MRCKASGFVALRRPSCVFVDNSFFRSCDVVTGGRPRRERGRPARTTLAKVHPSPRPSSTGSGARALLQPGPRGSRRRGGRLPHRGETERPPNAENAGETPALPERAPLPSLLLLQGGASPFTLASQVGTRRLAGPQAVPMRCRCPALWRFVDLRVSSWITLFSVVATPSWDDARLRERGRPARTTLAKVHPSPRPSSTGSGAGALLQPGPRGSRRRGGRLPHRGETERPPNAENAGETPALPERAPLPSLLLLQGGASPFTLASQVGTRRLAGPQAVPMRQSRSASWPFVDLRVSSWKTLFSVAATPSRADAPAGSAGVPPAQHWQRLTHLLGRARPAAAPGLCFSRARAVPAGGVAGCPIAGKLSGHPTQRMRARRPRSRRGRLLPSLLPLQGASPPFALTPPGGASSFTLAPPGGASPITIASRGGTRLACWAAGRADAVQGVPLRGLSSTFVCLRG